jgi:hypothetical protein
MLDVDTFLTALYVMVDDFCHCQPPKRRPGPKASLSESEVITLAIFARWGRFCGERDFYRYARRRLHDAFPTLPDRSQFNRLVRSRVGLIEKVALHLALMPNARANARGAGCYEALDTSAMPVRDAKRRGEGWLAGQADIGWSNSLGWYEGFRLLLAVDPTGVITGFGFASASTKDQPLAETFFALRARPDPRLGSAGSAASGPYVVDKGFEGEDNHRRWLDRYGAQVICPPKRGAHTRGVGPSGCGVGRRASARLWKPSTRSSTLPSAFAESGLTSFRVCGHVWPRGLRCITSASGSTTSSADLG